MNVSPRQATRTIPPTENGERFDRFRDFSGKRIGSDPEFLEIRERAHFFGNGT
jgi:hypothetical protein